jgi:hypothetical protein
MGCQTSPPKIRIFAARAAPRCVITYRAKAKLYLISLMDTTAFTLTFGLFRGRIYEDLSDFSFDGRWFAFHARGLDGTSLSAVCQPPNLTPVVKWGHPGDSGGGGWWLDDNTLVALGSSYGRKASPEAPFSVVPHVRQPDCNRDAKEGWIAMADLPEESVSERMAQFHQRLVEEFPGWYSRPSPRHPKLIRRFRITEKLFGLDYEYVMSEGPLAGQVWKAAAWDALGQLIVADGSRIRSYSVTELGGSRLLSEFDLSTVTLPSRESSSSR